MARFSPGDPAVVNGMNVTIRSWPTDDAGPFVVSAALPDGSDVLATYWVSNTAVTAGQLGVIPIAEVVPGTTDAPQQPVITQSVTITEKPGTVQAEPTARERAAT